MFARTLVERQSHRSHRAAAVLSWVEEAA
jgi:hypothetical protein